MSWLDLLLKQTEEYESPERYIWWSGLAAVSAVVRRNIWLQRGKGFRLYPNIYVLLISPDPALRKGLPVLICKTVLQKLDRVRIIAGCNSIQGVIQELSNVKSDFKSGASVTDAQGIMIAPELEVFLLDDPKALSTLMDLYNASEHETPWVKTLKSGTIELKAPYLTLLAASNETLLDKVIKPTDRMGGFFSRSVVVLESESRCINSLVDDPETDIDYDELVKRLLQISELKGPFQWSADAKTYYRNFYEGLRRDKRPDPTGAFGRLGDQVLRVAMLISLAKKDDLILEVADLDEAAEKCLRCLKSSLELSKSTSLPTNGDRPDVRRLIEKYLMAAPDYILTRTKIKGRLHAKGVYAAAIDMQIKELMTEGWLTITRSDGELSYQLTDEGYRNLAGESFRKAD